MEVMAVLSIDRPPSRWVSWGSLVWPLDPSGGDDESGHRFGHLSPADHANLGHSPEPDESIRDESYAIPPSTRERASLGEPSTKSRSKRHPWFGAPSEQLPRQRTKDLGDRERSN